jgi:hypothetical protein
MNLAGPSTALSPHVAKSASENPSIVQDHSPIPNEATIWAMLGCPTIRLGAVFAARAELILEG